MSLPSRSEIAGVVLNLEPLKDNKFRAHPPHIGGAFKEARLFGGQAVAQAHAAFRLAYPGDVAQSLTYKFISAGPVNRPVDYEVLKTGDVVRVVVYDGEKMIGSAFIRISTDGQLLPSNKHTSLSEIPDPDEISFDADVIKSMGSGRSLHLQTLLNTTIFEVKIAQLNMSGPLSTEMKLWGKAHDEIKDVLSQKHGMDICIMLSDFFIIQVITNHYKNFGMELQTGASLNHSLQFHRRPEDCDPSMFHLFYAKATSLSFDRALIRGNVFDRNLEPILTLTQEAYVQPSVPKPTLAKL